MPNAYPYHALVPEVAVEIVQPPDARPADIRPCSPTKAHPNWSVDGDGNVGPGYVTGVTVTETPAEASVVVDVVEATTPNVSALKDEWVDYVVTNFEVTREEIEAMTKAEILETYGR